MSDNKEIIRKLLKIAENQQKIITKLAQAAETEEQKKARWEAERATLKVDQKSNFSYGKLSADNPYRDDPLYAGEAPAGAPRKTTPSTLQPAPVAKQVAPQAPKSMAPQGARAPQVAGLLPSNLVAALEAGAPGLKGALNVKINGKSLDISYNADYVKGKLGLSSNDVKRVLTNAVAPTYEIVNVIGYTNPDKTTWKPNFT